MASKREKSPNKRMRKVALIICEGETEAGYVNMLKRWYRSPIRIISHIEGTKITQTLVSKRMQELKISPKENISAFLMYDMDVPAINEKLKSCKAELLLSNPCFEIWLLLHTKDQRAALSSGAVLKELKKSATIWNNYNKAAYTETQKTFLRNHMSDAIVRAKKLKDFQNPSTRVYKFIEFFEEA